MPLKISFQHWSYFSLKETTVWAHSLLFIQNKKPFGVDGKYSDEVLPYAIKKLKAAGYRLVSLSECTGLPAYQSVQAPSVRDVSYQMIFFINFIFLKKRSLFVLLVDLEVLDIYMELSNFFSFHIHWFPNYGKKKKDITSALHSSNLVVVLFLTFSWIPNVASLFSILFRLHVYRSLPFFSKSSLVLQ